MERRPQSPHIGRLLLPSPPPPKAKPCVDPCYPVLSNNAFGPEIGFLGRMTGSASAQGVPTAAVKVVGGSGGGGTKKIQTGAVLAFFFWILRDFPDF